MSYVTSRDGTRIFYKDWGSGRPIVFSHGWPLDADAWDAQMLFLLHHGYRVIAHDRRGHGRSDQPASGNDMDTFADDLAVLIDALDLKAAVLVGHSTGGGEVARYVGRHGTRRIDRIVLIGAVPPLMLKTAANPDGLPIAVFDGLRAGVAVDRPRFFQDLALAFHGCNRLGATPSQGLVDWFCLQGMRGGIRPEYDCIEAFSETDFNEDLRKFNVPTLFIHGDDDQIVPFPASACTASKRVRNSTLKVYAGGPHGICSTQADRVNADLLAFLDD
ncbi:alpha/beta fold hydrolase [Variovorax saccharolyticus]|uniref:alpha/beta fold hydrolase n=1 Tax=Variovorax saccharolyticus TaxID=3053516 RepID=UPI0025771609|nr:alpha/beta hydrolase [Variovorax sp. J31P216]MDM0025290.1 alpha/beta hydrolase [Variovorax sp. J31P216]